MDILPVSQVHLIVLDESTKVLANQEPLTFAEQPNLQASYLPAGTTNCKYRRKSQTPVESPLTLR